MCVAASRAGRDDIVRIALENFNLPYDPAAGMLCAQMLQAALSARPAAVEVARMLVETGAVDPMQPLPLRDVSVNVSVGGRTTSRILGEQDLKRAQFAGSQRGNVDVQSQLNVHQLAVRSVEAIDPKVSAGMHPEGAFLADLPVADFPQAALEAH